MNYEWTDEERLLAESVKRFFADKYQFQQRTALIRSGSDCNRQRWPEYASLGLTSVGIDQKYGGTGRGSNAAFIILQAMGRVLALEPFQSTVVQGAYAIQALGDERQAQGLLPSIVSGELVVACVGIDGRNPYSRKVVASQGRSGWQLHGKSELVPHGNIANTFVVAATVGNDTRLFLVDQKSAGLTIGPSLLQNATTAARLTFQGVDAEPLGSAETGRPVLRTLIAKSHAAVCASAVGMMEAVLEKTIEYVNYREQFGTRLSQNQAVQHSIADMFVALEKSRALALLAHAISENPTDDQVIDILRARFIASRSGRMVTQQGVQLHGALGMTEECSIGHYLRHQIVLDQIYGGPESHIEALYEAEARSLQSSSLSEGHAYVRDGVVA